MDQRIAAVEEYLAERPGIVGIVLHDRDSGERWANEHADTHIWACSTPKLAMVVDLLLRNDSGDVSLTDTDRDLIRQMLYSSEDRAADALWGSYGGEDFASRFPTYGMIDMTFTDEHPHTWGWIRTTAADLERLMRYVLEELPKAHRDYLVAEMRAVAPNQQWGVWGAGPDALPGNKNGWSDDDPGGGWVINSAGFVGPGERYSVAIMNSTGMVEGGYEIGKETTTGVAARLLA
jgi:hypothetical protein